uniref:Glycosyltransferase n=1 Tax=viral metagenome TaxID=1070528 RepID=A0A6C0EQK2_9ZZZZ
MSQLDFEDFDNYLLKQNGRIIHQIWFGTIPNKRAARKAYEKMKFYRDSWKIHNPTWCHIEWNKDMCKNLIAKIFPEHAEMFGRYKYEIQRCDAIRYLILYRYGGLYADMDYYCNRPFDEALKKFNGDIYIVETPNTIPGVNATQVSNSLMYSKPKHPFWKILMIELEKNQVMPVYYTKHLTVMFTTGPSIVNRVYVKNKLRFRLKSFPSKLFHPYGITSELRTTKLPSTIYAAHISKSSWATKDTVFLNTIVSEWPALLLVLTIAIVPLLYYLLRIGR